MGQGSRVIVSPPQDALTPFQGNDDMLKMTFLSFPLSHQTWRVKNCGKLLIIDDCRLTVMLRQAKGERNTKDKLENIIKRIW